MFAATAPSPRSVRATHHLGTATPAYVDRACGVKVHELPLYSAPGRTEPAVFVRRQVMALLLAAVVLGALSFGLRSAVGALTPAPASGGEGVAASIVPSASASAARPVTYIVQPGDTLWTIARSMQPNGDPASLVRALAKANGGADIDTGDVLVIP